MSKLPLLSWREVVKVLGKVGFFLVEEVILRRLPKAKASAREIAEIKKSIAEMRAGESVTLEELACA